MSNLFIEERLSDSPFVERIWRSRCEESGDFTSIALSHWEMVVWTQGNQRRFTIHGPESKPTIAPLPAHEEFVGIVFKLGTYMPLLPTPQLIDSSIDLPDGASDSFWLDSSVWEFPTYENADTFVNRLVNGGLIAYEPVVDAALQGHLTDLSLRSIQRRFLKATGFTLGTVTQIERARRATMLLKDGMSILDTIYETGYADQPHLTRSLKQFIGQTPAQLSPKSEPEQLSFLFKTEDF
jgi:AraC-like DNA-binding protein